MAVIEADRLTKTFTSVRKEPGLVGSLRGLFSRQRTEVHAVREVSFTIDQGELVGFLGPNGAGKTTVLKMLSGILYPTSGRACLLGYVPWERRPEMQKQFSLVMGQKNQLWWDLPAAESFLMLKELYEVEDRRFRARVAQLTELLEVRHLLHTQVRKLSLGERMKMELVAALLHSPRVTFMDEPTIGLDVVAQKRIREFIKEYNRTEKTTIVLTSHYMDDIQELCDRVIIIDHGRVLFDDQLQVLLERYGSTRLLKLTFNAPVPREVLERAGRVQEANGVSATLEVPRREVARVAGELLTHLPIADVIIADVEADDVIREVFAGKVLVPEEGQA
ncbi:MAG: ATP-binding cassette domain-containing protein [Armatimonadetes bacterium]|nr:ATP-binding cassette domain-containing protein [Armatimonadota bacterium]